MSGKENQTDAAGVTAHPSTIIGVDNELEMEPSVSDQTVEGSAP